MSERVLPDRRNLVRQRAQVGNAKIYLDLGKYDDDTIGEMFIVVEKTGAERRWLYDEVARLSSKLLQHGCSLEQLAEGWLGTKGDQFGPVQGDDRIKNATSILDYCARHILVNYADRDDLAHVKKMVTT